ELAVIPAREAALHVVAEQATKRLDELQFVHGVLQGRREAVTPICRSRGIAVKKSGDGTKTGRARRPRPPSDQRVTERKRAARGGPFSVSILSRDQGVSGSSSSSGSGSGSGRG